MTYTLPLGSPERNISLATLVSSFGEDGSRGAHPISLSGCKVLSVIVLLLLWMSWEGELVYLIRCCHLLDLPQSHAHVCVNTQPIQNHWPSQKTKSPKIIHKLFI